MEKTEIRSIQFLISGKGAAEMLDLIDETFHLMTLAIPPFILFPLFSSTRMRWDHHFHAFFQQTVVNRREWAIGSSASGDKTIMQLDACPTIA